MAKASYVVLRTDSQKAETIGPRATVFNSFKNADEYARGMRDRYTHQTFIVCQAVAAYEMHLAGTVMALLPDGAGAEHGAVKRQSQRLAKRNLPETTDSKNIVEMRSRKADGKYAEEARRKS
jgi:hypothetical protein